MKQIKDFLDSNKINKNFSNLSVEHFNQGLDPNIVDNNGEELWISCYNETINITAYHILNILFSIKAYEEESANFVVKTFVSLKDKIDQKHIDILSFLLLEQNFKKLEILKDNNMLNINANIEGYNMLACTKSKTEIEWLVKNGCDINHKVSNKKSPNHGKTVYDMALESKKKGWISYLKNHLPQDLINNNNESKLNIFRQEKKPVKQLKLYLTALKEKNYSIIDDIINNPNTYQQLIAFEDGIGKNLIRYAIGHNANDVLEKIIKLDYYQNNKTAINKHNECYTTNAINLEKNVSAKILYENGFKNDKSLFSLYENEYPSNSIVLSFMIDNGYKPKLQTRFDNFCYHKLENLTKTEIDQFFNENSYLLNLQIKPNPQNNNIFHVIYENGSYATSTKDGSFKLVSLILAQQEKIDPERFEQNFYQIMGSLGKHEKKVALHFGLIILENISSKNLIDSLGYYQRSDWLIELNHEKLSSTLEQFNDEDKPIIKKIKI